MQQEEGTRIFLLVKCNWTVSQFYCTKISLKFICICHHPFKFIHWEDTPPFTLAWAGSFESFDVKHIYCAPAQPAFQRLGSWSILRILQKHFNHVYLAEKQPRGVVNVCAVLSSLRLLGLVHTWVFIISWCPRHYVLPFSILHENCIWLVWCDSWMSLTGSSCLCLGLFIDKMSDYGMGFLMAGVALIISALFLLVLNQMNRRSSR